MKIKVSNIEKVKAAVEKEESGCTARLLDLTDVPYAVKLADEKLNELGIPKKYWVGTVLLISPPKPANSYKYVAEGTYMRINRCPSAWFVTKVWRGPVYTTSWGTRSQIKMELSELAKQNIPNSYRLS